MYYRNLFTPDLRDLFQAFNHLQREVQGWADPSPAIRGLGRGGFPALNVGTTPEAVEVYAFLPGVDPASIDVQLDRGVLTIRGERAASVATGTESTPATAAGKTTLHSHERFAGRFSRVVSLPDDIEPSAVTAQAQDGVLRVRVPRRVAAQPRRIDVQ